MIDDGNCHRCDRDPIEAGSYCLQAEGEMIKKFRANGKVELKVDVAEDSEQEEKTTKHRAVDVPVDFPRQESERVCMCMNKCCETDIRKIITTKIQYQR